MADPVATIDEGQLRGKISKDFLGTKYYSFLGIPYAKAPIGDLRFKAPQPVEPWKGIRNATKQGPECPSLDIFYNYYTGSEDNCLNLNVFTRHLPENNNDPLQPVMVWIHGGGFVQGSNTVDVYNPNYLITEDVVIVCINYRLGVLGFLSLEDSTLGVPGNAGLKDMVLALQWVQKNIINFCGDPNNVTIFGQSAGAASVQFLYLSPLCKGLFHKAIAQSGSALNWWAKGCNNGQIIAKNLGLEESDEKKILEHLRNIPVKKIVDAQNKNPDLFEPRTIRPFGPVIEKGLTEPAFLSEDPISILRSGKFHHVPLIIGYTTREGLLFEALRSLPLRPHATTVVNFEREIFFDVNIPLGSKKSKDLAEKIKKYYYGEEEPSEENIDKLYLLRTDNLFLHGIYESIFYQKLTTTAPIYFYKFTLDASFNHFKTICTTKHIYILFVLLVLEHTLGDGFIKNFLFQLNKFIPKKLQPGTCHSDEIGYMFKTPLNGKLEPGSIEETCVKRLIRLWANFAKTGNPTPNKDDPLLKSEWKSVTKDTNFILDIGAELKLEMDEDYKRIKFWSSIYE